MIKSKEKKFDCIEMKNNIQSQIYAETMEMTKTELLHYFNGCVKQKLSAPHNTATVSTVPVEPPGV